LINTKAESTRTILPRIILPKLVKFYTIYREPITDLIMLHRKRKQERIEKERNEDICVSPEQKPSVKPKKREFKRKGKKSEEEEETKLADIENDKVKAANGAIEEEDDSAELRLVDELTLNLNDDPSLFQIDDVDLNYIVFN